MRRKHPGRTTATKKEESKQVENKQRDGRRNRWDTTRVLSPKQPKQRTLSNGSTRRQAQKQVENKENFVSQTYPEKRIAIDREVRKQV